ncbi:MAG TPA: glycerophosphodiester phosphodiesterase [Acidimicrobiales bacterium]|nr:glycerophosphodiester phosphodiesterase [Acidimicrobiales bacterium]
MSKVFAHRGVHHQARENTLEAFKAARRLGVDGVELDVRRSADGALVVHHDEACEQRLVAKTRAGELPSYVCTLEEALDALLDLEVNVEIKNLPSEVGYDDSGGFAAAVVQCVRASGLEARALISSFDLATCQNVREVAPEIAVGWLLWKVEVPRAVDVAALHGFRAVHPHFSTLGSAEVAQARDAGVDLNVWTVNHRRDLLRFSQWGVAALITDEPAVALALGRGSP